MSDKYFLDTNIFIYSFDSQNSSKRTISEELIKNALSGKGHISIQVVQEFLNVSTKKSGNPMNSDEAKYYISKVLFPICKIFPTEQLYYFVLEIKEKFKFSFYDSLIIAAAIEANCKTLYSEDLQHNQKIYDLAIVNPFVE
jgi:predicted nucleic acid-binding protein